MTAKLELGHESYTIERGTITADTDDVAQVARAKYLSAAAVAWRDERRHEGSLPHYDPDPDCTLAKVIAEHIKGRWRCLVVPEAAPGTVH